MNPLRWSLFHQIGWIVVTVLGAAIGLFFGLSRFQVAQWRDVLANAWAGSAGAAPNAALWPGVAIGALTAALAFYVGKLMISGRN